MKLISFTMPITSYTRGPYVPRAYGGAICNRRIKTF